MQLKYKKMACYLSAAVFLIIIDRFFKMLALRNFSFEIIGEIFQFSLAENYYIAFSIPFTGVILNFAVLLIIIILMGYFFQQVKKKQNSETLPLLFIIFGALSNLFDRLRHGYVVDYFDLKWFTVLNIADMMIVGGIGLILYSVVIKKNNI